MTDSSQWDMDIILEMYDGKPQSEQEVSDDSLCKKCGCCCILKGPRPITGEEVELISHKTGLKSSDFVDDDNSLLSPCSFIKRQENDFKCVIYDYRPQLCKTFSNCKVLNKERDFGSLIKKWHKKLSDVIDTL